MTEPPKTPFDIKDKSHLKNKYVPVDFKKLFVPPQQIYLPLLLTNICFMIPAWLHYYYYNESVISFIYTFECFLQIIVIYYHLTSIKTFNWISLSGCMIKGYYQRPDITSRVALLTIGFALLHFNQKSKYKMNIRILLLCVLNFSVRNVSSPADFISALKGFYWGLSFMFYPPLINKIMKYKRL